MALSEFAGKPVPQELIINVPRLMAAYYAGRPDPLLKSQQVSFGTSGHRGCSLDRTFNERHILELDLLRFREAKYIAGDHISDRKCIGTHRACISIPQVL